MEAHLATRRHDAPPQSAHHLHQLVRADVRLRLPKDLPRRARVRKRLQHVANVGALRAGGELAVRERARAAFAELDVRARIERPARVERRHGGQALVHVAPALQHERAQPRLGQVEGREQAGGARAHDDGPRLAGRRERAAEVGRAQGRARLVRLHARSRDGPGPSARRRGLKRAPFDVAGQLHGDGRHEADVAPLARVHAALEQPHAAHGLLCHAERVGDRRAHERLGALPGQPRVERKSHVRHLKHGIPPFPRA